MCYTTYSCPNRYIMIKLWKWLLGEYKLWKLRRQDPFIYEGDDEDDYDEDDVA